jgi:large subunit ribosomal protein L25
MSDVRLDARPRKAQGKGGARKLRAAGHIPAVLYGPGEQPQPLEITTPDFMKIYHGGHGENVLIDLNIGSGEPRKVLFREVQRDPVSEEILHVDFYHVSLTKPIRVHVPVHLEGLPIGVKDSGGVLQHIMREVEIECLPTEIPDHFTVNVSELKIHDAVHVTDLPTGKFTLIGDLDRTVASVVPPVVIKEAVPGEAAVVEGEAPTEPERIGEKKEEGEEGEEAKEGKEKPKASAKESGKEKK